MVKLVLCGVIAGLVLFGWLGFSWAVLPFHRAAFKQLPESRPSVLDALGAASSTYGVYYSGKPHEGTTGPQVPFLVYLPQGYPAMGRVMGQGVLLCILAAFLLSLIVNHARLDSFKARLGVCVLTGLVVALAGPLTMGNFFFFPANWMLPDVFDQIIGWTLAGLVIAAFTKPTAAATSAPT